jgi:hypothetical protein
VRLDPANERSAGFAQVLDGLSKQSLPVYLEIDPATNAILDPSLFTTPVLEATWKGVQGDLGATLTYTDASVFWHGGGTGPTYSGSNAILAQYHLALQTRSIQVGRRRTPAALSSEPYRWKDKRTQCTSRLS